MKIIDESGEQIGVGEEPLPGLGMMQVSRMLLLLPAGVSSEAFLDGEVRFSMVCEDGTEHLGCVVSNYQRSFKQVRTERGNPTMTVVVMGVQVQAAVPG